MQEFTRSLAVTLEVALRHSIYMLKNINARHVQIFGVIFKKYVV